MVVSVTLGLCLRSLALWTALFTAVAFGFGLSTLTDLMLRFGKLPLPWPMRLAAFGIGAWLGRVGGAVLDFAQRLADGRAA
jgi:hypothetical protein